MSAGVRSVSWHSMAISRAWIAWLASQASATYEASPDTSTRVTKHLIDVDEDQLGASHAEIGTANIADTVNHALRLVANTWAARVAAAFDVLAAADLDDRDAVWR